MKPIKIELVTWGSKFDTSSSGSSGTLQQVSSLEIFLFPKVISLALGTKPAHTYLVFKIIISEK